MSLPNPVLRLGIEIRGPQGQGGREPTHRIRGRYPGPAARILERRHPELVVSDMKKSLRTGKVFVDWSQNDDHKTTVCVYSLRAKDRPTVSTPVTWKEVEQCLRKRDPAALVFEAEQVLARVEKLGDLFAPVLKKKQKLPPAGALREIDSQAAPGAPRRPAPARRLRTGTR